MPQRGGPGLTWDEAFYYPTYEAVGDWVAILFRNPSLVLSDSGIEAGWTQIHELPPVVKWLGAACAVIPATGWDKLALVRLFPAAASALSFVLLFLISRRLMPAGAALCVLLLYAALPAVQGHALLAATETVFITITLLTAWVALHDLRQWKWKLALAACCGVAIATKVNGIILTGVVCFWLMTVPVVSRMKKNRRASFTHNAVAIALIMTVGLLIAFVLWPWLWHHTAERIAEYWAFIQNHAKQGVWFQGRKWNFGGPDAPMYYPLMMAIVQTPAFVIMMMLVALVGLLRWVFVRRRLTPALWLLLLLSLAPIAVSSLPSTPRYDGIRLFLPMFAPLMIITVRGAFGALRWMGLKWSLRRVLTRLSMANVAEWIAKNRRPFACGVFLLLLGALSLEWDIDHARKSGDKIYAQENTYWGNAIDKRCADNLNEVLPANARVKTLALQVDALKIYQQWGVLRGDIIVDGEPPYDAHLLQNRKGFWGNAEWWFYSERKPLMTWGKGPTGEPLIMLYDGKPPGER